MMSHNHWIRKAARTIGYQLELTEYEALDIIGVRCRASGDSLVVSIRTCVGVDKFATADRTVLLIALDKGRFDMLGSLIHSMLKELLEES